MPQTTRNVHEMYPLIEIYLQGHLTQKAFCAEHDLTRPVLNYWISKYRKQSTEISEAFIEIQPSASTQVLLEIDYPHGVRLRLFRPVTLAYLEGLLTLR